MDLRGGLDRARTLLQQAHAAAGASAYQYFFKEATPGARETYVAALEAEAEAELLLAVLRGEDEEQATAE